jgi:cyclopropane fatty-acyl-phospholipid synthase-like methyltransferase
MTRISTPIGAISTVRLDSNAVADFFSCRADRIGLLGPVRAVIYQDNNKELANQRDLAEIQKLLPKLSLDGSQCLLDLGCGTGRWVARIAGQVNFYHGIDFSEGLLAYAEKDHAGRLNCHFTRMSAADISPESLGENSFDRILCAGLLIYMNDDELEKLFQGILSVAASNCRVIFREPMGVGKRLTLDHHFSAELEAEYHAIYRTEEELLSLMNNTLMKSGFCVVERGNVYDDPSLNNREETLQCYIILKRGV